MKCFIDDWFKIIYELPEGITLRRQITRTFKTRDKKAQESRIGHWKMIRENYDFDRLERFFKADASELDPTATHIVCASRRKPSNPELGLGEN